MKRRNLFAALAGVPLLPFAAKAVEPPKPVPPLFVVNPNGGSVNLADLRASNAIEWRKAEDDMVCFGSGVVSMNWDGSVDHIPLQSLQAPMEKLWKERS